MTCVIWSPLYGSQLVGGLIALAVQSAHAPRYSTGPPMQTHRFQSVRYYGAVTTDHIIHLHILSHSYLPAVPTLNCEVEIVLIGEKIPPPSWIERSELAGGQHPIASLAGSSLAGWTMDS